MAISQKTQTQQLTTQEEVASRVILLMRNVSSVNKLINVNFNVDIIPESIIYELDENNNKIGIWDRKDLDRLTMSLSEISIFFTIPVTLQDGTQTTVGELLSAFTDQFIANTLSLTNNTNITTQAINLDAVIYKPTFTISGNTGISGVTLTYDTGKTVISDSNGNYSFTEKQNWTGTIIPTLDGYTFTPGSIAINNISNNLINQNFVQTVNPTNPTV